MSRLKSVSVLLVVFAFGASMTCGRTFAQSDSTFPNYSTPAAAAARDADAPDPQYADGSPGQYVLEGTQRPQPGGKGAPITITCSFQNMFDGALKLPNGQPLPASFIRRSIEEALHLWSNVAPLNFDEVPDDGLWYGSSTHSRHYQCPSWRVSYWHYSVLRCWPLDTGCVRYLRQAKTHRVTNLRKARRIGSSSADRFANTFRIV
jgi:hypothetical protein